jgi:hypothetical protein
MSKVYNRGRTDGIPDAAQFTGVDPGDLLVAFVLGQWKVYSAHATGLPDGSVQWVDTSQFLDSAVSLYSPTDGQVLTYDAATGKWTNKAATGGSSTLAADTDVQITSPADSDVLTYSVAAGKWQNKPAQAGSASDFMTLPYRGYIYPGPSNNLGALGDSTTLLGGSYSGPIQTSDGPNGLGPSILFESFNSVLPAGFCGLKNYRIDRNAKLLVEAALSTTTHPLVWIAFVSSGNAGLSNLGKHGRTSYFAAGGLVAGFRLFNGQDTDGNVGSDATWQAVVYVPGAASPYGDANGKVVDTGVAPDVLKSHRFAVIFDNANTRVLFYIDGSQVASISLAGVSILNDDLKDVAAYVSTCFTSSAGSISSPFMYFSQAQMQADF